RCAAATSPPPAASCGKAWSWTSPRIEIISFSASSPTARRRSRWTASTWSRYRRVRRAGRGPRRLAEGVVMPEQAQAVSRSLAPRGLPQPARQAARLRGALAVLLAAMVGVALFLLGCTYRKSEGAFNSDHLYPSAVCEDFRLGRDLSGWYLPGAPYLFPDMALILPCQVLSGNVVGE